VFGQATRTKDALMHERFGFGGAEGELYGIVGPGMHAVMPFTHSIEKISVRPRTVEYKGQSGIQINLEDKQLQLDSFFTWAVRDDDEHPYRAIFNVADEIELCQAVGSNCIAALGHVARNVEKRELLDDDREIFRRVNIRADGDLSKFGARLITAKVIAHTETLGEMLRQSGQMTHQAILGAAATTQLGMEGVIPGLHAVDTALR
jgi:uncharacterized membrane protein YqiK